MFRAWLSQVADCAFATYLVMRRIGEPVPAKSRKLHQSMPSGDSDEVMVGTAEREDVSGLKMLK